jgi:hypothetical protein
VSEKPKTAADRVRASEARKIKAGWRRTSPMMLSPNVSAALDGLLNSGFASSITGCFERAILEAESKRKWK